ncbi:MAG: hypothetical protein GF311_16330 [Candidatus Lokiarchaeota archaeon]|nr:hypothetical protein [Candidatus Lokiarchaeota archaeon]
MKDQKLTKIANIFLIGIILFFFIEAFYNLIVEVNAYVFMNLSEIVSLLPVLITSIILIVLLVVSFNTKKIVVHKYRISLIILIISIVRLIAQFIPWTSILLILNFLLLFSGMIFFNEIIILTQTQDTYLNVNELIAGLILGLGFQFIFLIIDISSNITTNFTKLIPLLIILVCINIINKNEYFPRNLRSLSENTTNQNSKKKISYIHFIILGILFLTGIMWFFNPMALSAYGIINLNYQNTEFLFPWISYGFTYYIFIILIAAIAAFYLTTRVFLKLKKNMVRIVSIILGILFLFLNGLSLLFIESPRSSLATIFFTIITIINVFFLLYYILYLFNAYSFNYRLRLLFGLIIFFMTIFIFIIIQVQILWYEYISLLINVIILVGTAGILMMILEVKNFGKILERRDFNLKFDRRATGYLFIGVFIINSAALGVITLQRGPVPPTSENPIFMTWNIHNAIGVDDKFELDRLVEQIKTRNPDVLGLNEVDLGALKTSFIDIGSYFAHKLNMYYYYGYTFYKHYGNMLLSKYPISNAEIIKLPLNVSSAEPRSMIKAHLEINSTIWTVYITHLSTKKDDRIEQVKAIVNEMNGSAFEKIVWMGDFNFEPTDTEYLLINSTIPDLNFTDTYRKLNTDPGYTGHFDDEFEPQKRIDYIMCSPDLTPLGSEVWCSEASDHCAVITQF